MWSPGPLVLIRNVDRLVGKHDRLAAQHRAPKTWQGVGIVRSRIASRSSRRHQAHGLKRLDLQCLEVATTKSFGAEVCAKWTV